MYAYTYLYVYIYIQTMQISDTRGQCYIFPHDNYSSTRSKIINNWRSAAEAAALKFDCILVCNHHLSEQVRLPGRDPTVIGDIFRQTVSPEPIMKVVYLLRKC